MEKSDETETLDQSFVVGLTAGLLTFLAMRWAMTSYAEPTCGRDAESIGMTYIKYEPLDPTINSSHAVYEGDCQLLASNGEVQTVSLVKAGGTSYGAPFLVGFALSWHRETSIVKTIERAEVSRVLFQQ